MFKKDNTKMIIIASLIAAIVIILVVGCILFFVTDFFKSDKDLFLKYVSQNLEIIENYLEDPNQSTMEALKNQPYTVKSDINFDLVSNDPEIANQTIPPRNFSISYTKNANPQANQDKSEAKVKYLTKDLFSAVYVHDGDRHALNGNNLVTSTPIINMYLGIDNNDLKQLGQKLGAEDVSKIPNSAGRFTIADLMNITDEEKTELKQILEKIYNTQISQGEFHHIKNKSIEIDTKQVTANGYSVTLTKDQYQNTIIALLNEISNNDRILNMILKKIDMVDLKTDITLDNLKEQIQNSINQINISSGITLQVYEVNGKLVRMQIEKEDNNSIIIDYERDGKAVRTLITLNYNYEESTPQEQEPVISNTIIEDGYQVIEGSQSVTQTTEPASEVKSIMKIKKIELAKQIKDNQNNIVAIVECEQDNKAIKISLQSNTQKGDQGLINNFRVNINDSETTYFTVTAASTINTSDNVQTEELNDSNSAVLNNRTKENAIALIDAIKTQLQRTYNELMEVAKQVQEQEDAQSGLNSVNPNAPEANVISNMQNVIQ